MWLQSDCLRVSSLVSFELLALSENIDKYLKGRKNKYLKKDIYNNRNLSQRERDIISCWTEEEKVWDPKELA